MIDNDSLETQDTNNVVEELSGDTPIESTNPEVPKVEAPQPTPKPTSGQQENFRNLRERAERAEREREEYARKVAEYEAKSKPREPEEDLDFNIGADEIAEGKHLTKVGRKIKQLEEKIAQADRARQELQQQSETNSVLSGIKADFPDIDKVVNADTMEALKQRAPHLERTIRSSTDLYSKAAAAYQAIKDMGIYVDDVYVAEKDKVQKNLTKPRSTAAVAGTGTPLSQADIFANGLTPELKDRLHKEMLEAIKAR